MPLKILIVEDLFIEANDLRIILERAGHTITGTPKSVDQALAAIKRDKPDIVLLDIFLKGDLTGIHLAKNLTAANIPFIYLSANSNVSTLEAAKATQPYGFLVKPYREKDILVALDIASHRHRHALEMARRQEQWLASLLSGIISQAATREQKLLLLTKAFKTSIPFDLVFIDMDRRAPCFDAFFGCRRVDFDQFTPIDIQSLTNKFRLSAADVPAFREAFPHRARISIVPEQELTEGTRLAQRLQRVLGMRSALSVPVSRERSPEFSIYFFSIQPDSYSPEHLEVLAPLHNLLWSVVDNIRRQGSLPPPDQSSKPAATPTIAPRALENIIGRSPGLLRVLDLVNQVAPVDSTVLITGETGVGKEGIAKAIHQLSTRNTKPYVKINCAAIPETLIESELFGHERGAFTSALDRRIGKFEQANGGTIFLDEIGELPLQVQSKLLRVLQEKEIERLGGGVTIRTDVRIIAATNRQLYKEVAAGRFRMDLFYRLNVFPIFLPPLRDRKEDIPLLVDYFLKQQAHAFGSPPKILSPALLSQFVEYSWPGNIRELEYLIERSVIGSRTPIITEANLPEEIAPPAQPPVVISASPKAGELDKEKIMAALIKSNGKVSGLGGAAETLGVNPNTLASRMKKLGISWKYI